MSIKINLNINKAGIRLGNIIEIIVFVVNAYGSLHKELRSVGVFTTICH